jgi:hypothetical protein
MGPVVNTSFNLCCFSCNHVPNGTGVETLIRTTPEITPPFSWSWAVCLTSHGSSLPQQARHDGWVGGPAAFLFLAKGKQGGGFHGKRPLGQRRADVGQQFCEGLVHDDQAVARGLA